jgi:hypothetical protein
VSCFFPAGGSIVQSTAIVTQIGEVGGYWSSTIYTTQTPNTASFYDFSIDDNANGLSRMHHQTGNMLCPIRCVAQ